MLSALLKNLYTSSKIHHVAFEKPLALSGAKIYDDSLQDKQFHTIDVLWTQTLENTISGYSSSIDPWINTPLMWDLGMTRGGGGGTLHMESFQSLHC